MSCEEGDLPKRAEELTKPVDCYRAARKFERFMMGIDPRWRSGVDDLGDEHLSWDELMERRSREAAEQIDPKSFGDVFAVITYNRDQKTIKIDRVADSKTPDDNDLFSR